VSAPRASPGEPIVPLAGPLFPAATQTMIPSAVSASTSRASGDAGEPGPPSERFMTRTSCWLAHDIAARTASSVPPAAESAFAMTSDAPGATPR